MLKDVHIPENPISARNGNTSHHRTDPVQACCSRVCMGQHQAVLVYKCLHESAPAYLIDKLCQVADVEARQRLCSSSSSSLIVSCQAIPVAAARVWNSLPDLVTSAPSIAVFRSRLKTHLFNISYLTPCDCMQCLHSDT